MDAFETFALIFDLLGICKVGHRHATIVQHHTILLLFASAQLVEIRHRVRLGNLLFRQLVKIGLNKRAILTVLALFALVVETSRNCRLLLRERCVVRVQLVRR